MSPKSSPLPSTEELRHRLLQAFEDHRKLITGAGALLLVAVVGVILFVTLSQRAEEQQWSDLLGVTRSPLGDSTRTLEQIVELGDSEIVPYAMFNLAVAHIRNDEFDEALELIDRLEKDYGDAYLNSLPSPDRRYSLIGSLRRWIDSERQWKADNTFETPEVSTGRVALVETSKGSFWIGFYPDLSPVHVESFVALAKKGAFNGTQVYSVSTTNIMFGGETTRDDDPLNDEDADGEETLEPERGRYRIPQERGSVSSVATDEGESAMRIAVVTSRRDIALEKRQTVFGKLLTDRYPAMRGLDEIRNAKTYGASKDPGIGENPDLAAIPNHPVEQIRVERVSIWAGDTIEEGHTWDTSAVIKPKEEEEKPEDAGDGSSDEEDADEKGTEGAEKKDG